MGISGQSRTINDQTSLRDLQNFLSGAGRDSRLVATKGKDGEITLYATDKRAGLFDRVTGRAAKRREVAREAVSQVLVNHENRLASRGMSGAARQASGAVLAAVDRMNHQNNKSALRSGAALDRAEFARDAMRGLRNHHAAPAATPVLTPGMTTQDVQQLKQDLLAMSPGDLPKKGDQKPSAAFMAKAERFGLDMAAKINAQASGAEKKAFAFSDGAAFRREITEQLSRDFPADTMLNTGNDDHLALFAAKAFYTAAAHVSPDKAVPHTSTDPKLRGLPALSIGGTTYVPEKLLGEGSFGRVFQFKDASDNRVAVKIAKVDDLANFGVEESLNTDRTAASVLDEVAAHRGVADQGHDNVVGLRGAARLPDGNVAMVLDLASKDSLYSIGKAIDDVVGTGAGQISRPMADALKLTLLRDTAAGLAQVRQQGFMHLDFKSPNVLVGVDGKAKIADFGTSKDAMSLGAASIPKGIDNPRWQAPEMLYHKAGHEAVMEQASSGRGHQTASFKQHMAAFFPDRSQGDIDKLASDVADGQVAAAEKKSSKARIVDAQVDTWGLGVSAMDLFGIKFVHDEMNPWAMMYQQEQTLIAFREGGGNGPALRPAASDGSVADGALGRASGDAGVDGLINGMLDPRPENRTSLQGVLGAAALNGKGVGSDAAHGLIAAITRGDATDIGFFAGRLGAAMT